MRKEKSGFEENFEGVNEFGGVANVTLPDDEDFPSEETQFIDKSKDKYVDKSNKVI